MLIPINIVVLAEVAVEGSGHRPLAMAVDDKILCDLPGDKTFFKEITQRGTGLLVAGKKTYNSMPVDSINKDRKIIQVSRSGTTLAEVCAIDDSGFLWNVGGASLYEASYEMPLWGEIVVTPARHRGPFLVERGSTLLQYPFKWDVRTLFDANWWLPDRLVEVRLCGEASNSEVCGLSSQLTWIVSTAVSYIERYMK